MLDFINFEILDKTKPFATEVLIRFEETGVNTEKYSFNWIVWTTTIYIWILNIP